MNDWLFSLEPLRPLLESYTPPAVAADPVENRATYDLLSLSIKPHRVGTLEITTADKKMTLHLDRPGEDGYRSHTQADYLTDRDFFRLDRWQARVWMAPQDQPKNVYPFTELEIEGRASAGHALVEIGNERYSTPFSGTLTGKWPLLEHARRKAADPSWKIEEFASLDEYQIVFSPQQLQRGDWVEAPGGFTLCPLLNTGQGQIPRTFWVDREGRLLAYQSGTEAAILRELNGSEANYTAIRYDLRKMKLSPEFQS